MPYDYLLWQKLKKSILAGSPWTATSRSGRKGRASRNSGVRSPRIEPLESRRLLSINTPVLSSNKLTLYVTGTDDADFVTVSETAPGTIEIASMSGAEQLTTTFTNSVARYIIFTGNDGDDEFINNTSLIVRADGGLGNDTIVGGSGDDSLSGGEGKDFLVGNAGDDVLEGGNDGDYLEGSEGNDLLYGQQGNDEVLGGDGDDQIWGSSGNDALGGGEGDDRVFGGAGIDLLSGDAGIDRLEGGEGNDFLLGGSGGDTLLGGQGEDRLAGQEDNDKLYGEGGSDILSGGTGDDLLVGSTGDDELIGDEGDDRLFGDAGNDRLFGGAGADRLEGKDGNDLLQGGEGDDTLLGGAGEDQLEGEDGHDSLYGEADNDSLFGGLGNDLLVGSHGDDRLFGDQGDDRLLGDDGKDYLDGQSGADRLEGGAGADLLLGGSGADTILAGSGADRLYGQSGDDNLYGEDDVDNIKGGAGNDLILGGNGDDKLYGEVGDDRMFGESGNDFLNGLAGADDLDGGDGNDQLLGGSGADTIRGGSGADRLYGQSGDDNLYGEADVDIIKGGAGNDLMLGGIGNDKLYGEDGDDRMFGESGNDFLNGLAGDDELNGGDGNDQLLGGVDDDSISAGPGDDRLDGQAGDDYLLGEAGSDLIEGGDNNDRILGGLGPDTIIGGQGNDFLYGQEGADVLLGDAGVDRLEGGEGNDRLFGGAGDDEVLGDEGEDQLFGEDGSDFLFGGAGNDLVDGGAGNDTLRGAEGDDQLRGGDGADILFGGDDSDVLEGGDGNDNLNGEAGNDALIGGEGSDDLAADGGNDLLIGGSGIDQLYGNDGEDILIGARTHFDEDTEALRYVLSVWNNGESYDARVGHLESEHASLFLLSNSTVHDDYVPDEVYGGADRDWLFLPGVVETYDPLGIQHQEHHGEPDHGDEGHATPGHHMESPLSATPPRVEGFALIDSLDHLRDNQSNESVHTLIPHAGDASKRAEHIRLFELVRYADVTHAAENSGSWFDSSTWEDGIIPSADARVHIPIGAHVTVDRVSDIDLFSVRVDGTLSFATDVDSQLVADTVIVSNSGSFKMGTEATPVQSGVSARLLISDNGAIDRDWDPFALSRGLITHGSVEMYGAETTSFVAAAANVQAGATQINLAGIPVGWKVGDRLAIAGTVAGGGQDEVRQILAIQGNQVTVAPLSYSHAALEASLEWHVSNLNRNVTIESEATETQRRGHVMFMHNRDVHISHAGFHGLGRSNKLLVVNDSTVDSDWDLVEGTGTNPRARYSVHFHRNGIKADAPAATVHGSVVTDSPGWGFVNHSSYVDVTDSVTYDVRGAAFVAEAGDEIGSFVGNIAIHTTGTNEEVDARTFHQDFGFNGDGFWLQSPGLTVTDNVSAGSTGSAFFYYNRGLVFRAPKIQFLAENLDDPSLAAGQEYIGVNQAVAKEFSGNVGYASDVGLNLRYHLRAASHSGQSTFEDSVFWNNRTGIFLPYAKNTILKNLEVLSDPAADFHTGIDHNAITQSIVYDNLRVEGYYRGIHVAPGGDSIVDGGTFSNRESNIMIGVSLTSGRSVQIVGDPIFVSALGSLNKSGVGDHVTLRYNDNPVFGNISHLFNQTTITLNYGPFSNQRLYFVTQRADFIPFPAIEDGIPIQYVGLTNGELFSQYGLAISGEVAPSEATAVEGIVGLLAPSI